MKSLINPPLIEKPPTPRTTPPKVSITINISAPSLALPMTGYADRLHMGNNYFFVICPGKMRLENMERNPREELALFSLTMNNLNLYSTTIKKEFSAEPPQIMPPLTVIYDTDVRLKISRFPYVPSKTRDYIKNNTSCKQGEVGVKIVGAFASPIEVSFQKSTFEQLMRTIDNVMFSGDIDHVQGAEKETQKEDTKKSPVHNPGALKKFTPIKATIRIPLHLQLKQDLGDGVVSVARVKFPKIVVNFSKELYYYSQVDLKIFKTYIFDQIEERIDPESPHRVMFETLPMTRPILTKSKSSSNLNNLDLKPIPRSRSVSYNKPDAMTATPITTPTEPSLASLDNNQFIQTMFANRSKAKSEKEDHSELIHVKMSLVDGKSPEYQTVYDRWNRDVRLKFHGVQGRLNMRTFVTLLDFFSIGTEPELLKQRAKYAETRETQQVVNTKMQVEIESLRLLLNKDRYVLAVASLEGFQLDVKIKDNNMSQEGSVKSLKLVDKTKFGDRYQKRLVPIAKTVEPVLKFEFFKYGKKDQKNPYRKCFKI